MIKPLLAHMRKLLRRARVARHREKQIRREMAEQRFQDRKARHEAGIYERPGPGI